jgi:hypothetical protein
MAELATTAAAAAGTPAGIGTLSNRDLLRALLRKPQFVVCSLALATFFTMAAAPPLFTPVDPRACDLSRSRAPAAPSRWGTRAGAGSVGGPEGPRPAGDRGYSPVVARGAVGVRVPDPLPDRGRRVRRAVPPLRAVASGREAACIRRTGVTIS